MDTIGPSARGTGGDLNLTLLFGRVAAPAEHRVLDTGAHLLRVLVTVRSATPRRRVDVVPVVVWEPSVDLLEPPLAAGERIWVVAALRRRFWDGTDGGRSRLEIVADAVTRCPAWEDLRPSSTRDDTTAGPPDDVEHGHDSRSRDGRPCEGG